MTHQPISKRTNWDDRFQQMRRNALLVLGSARVGSTVRFRDLVYVKRDDSTWEGGMRPLSHRELAAAIAESSFVLD